MTYSASAKNIKSLLSTVLASIALLSANLSLAQSVLRVSAIPDESPTELQRKFKPLGEYLEKKLSMKVTFTPVTDYAASVEGLINNKGLKSEFNRGYSKRNSDIARLQNPKKTLTRAEQARLERLLLKKERVDESFAMADAAYDRQYSILEENAPRDSILVTNRFLDYGFVENLNEWQAECHGTVAMVNSKTLGFGSATRLCNSIPMRSDHFPVIYTWTKKQG